MASDALFIGLMSGTSMDGVDAVLASISSTSANVIAHTHCPYPAPLLAQLQTLCTSGDHEIESLGIVENGVAEVFSQAVEHLLATSNVNAEQVTAIGSHGQTIRHRPTERRGYPNSRFTLQVGDPNIIATRTQIPVVADFRRKDMALGGQGAPLAPAFHHAMLSSPDEAQIVLNLGGIANITYLPATHSKNLQETVVGFDTGPANTLLDAWYRRFHGGAYDVSGAWAVSGSPQQKVIEACLQDPYFSLHFPKSTGREYFNLTWLESRVPDLMNYAPADIQASLLLVTARSVATAIESFPSAQKVLVCGGGVFNQYLIKTLSQILPRYTIASTATKNIHPMHVEALAFAWLAHQYWHKLPGNMPAVTGARAAAVLGSLVLPI
ncbi:anhydro-N-acetylmuramic acid kinase [Alteromonas sp. ASW11-36]|uniref:Anhydro-N-acetylmuramic acid kinase n=1 Tax=Alteromonas arenosi TaxID=3055817 RepID=A0ABT7T1X3_9ALTE|nr:anhydro-N-acetylmuramic acid kinase [Alteromonas sp. ASW11-36]MDM7861794.1 anhydro-N-acetylmuramic acid kinase [Alteromonas sp. ASW11-36]